MFVLIYVSLGTHERPFYRLVKEIEGLIKEKKIKEKVIIQLGFTDYKVKGAKCYKYLEMKKYEKTLKNTSLIITHSGSGSILTALKLGKPVIAVPRRKAFGEHVNDHQLQIAEEMSKQKGVIAVLDIKNLEDAIKRAKKIKIKKLKAGKPIIFKIIERKLKEWDTF